jgi:hypothetical protein
MKITVRLSAFTICFLFTPISIFAQGEFLKRGESGWGVSTSAAFVKSSSAYGVSVGYSFKGILDFDLGVGRGYQEPQSFDGDDYQVYSNFIAPSITIYLAKQDSRKRTPTVALSLSYQYISIKTPGPIFSYVQNPTPYGSYKYMGKEIYTSNDRLFNVSLAFSSNVLKENSSIIQPIISFGYTRDKNVNQFGAQIGLSLGGRLEGDFILTLTPMVGYVFISGTRIFTGGLELAFVSF